MTFTASRAADGKNIEVRTTYGPITISVTEEPGHTRSFWGQLGRLLDTPDPGGKTHGQHAYEAYSKHVGGISVSGDELPAWGDQLGGIREAWEVAASAVRSASGMHVTLDPSALATNYSRSHEATGYGQTFIGNESGSSQQIGVTTVT